MKVLYVAHSSALHGAGGALINIVSGMIKVGVTPYVLLPNYGPVSERLISLGVSCFYTSYYMEIRPSVSSFRNCILWLPRYLRLVFSNACAAKKLKGLIRDLKPDVVHTNTGVIHFASKVAAKTNVPHVWHIREFQDLDFGWKPIYGFRKFTSLLRKNNNHCIAITHEIYRHHHMAKQNSCVIYDGVFGFESPPDIQWPKKKYLLFVGRLEEAKGVRDAIYAFMEVASSFPEFELWIVGEGNAQYTNSIMELAQKSTAYHQIKFLGFRDDVDRLMSDALALLVPSRFEGFGFITAEAMLNGCLVIGNNVAGTKEQFDNGFDFCGEEIGIRYTGVEELSERIRSLCSGKFEVDRSMIISAQECAFSFYSVKRNVESLCRIYTQITEKNFG